MNVQELLDKLSEVEDKSLPVYVLTGTHEEYGTTEYDYDEADTADVDSVVWGRDKNGRLTFKPVFKIMGY